MATASGCSQCKARILYTRWFREESIHRLQGAHVWRGEGHGWEGGGTPAYSVRAVSGAVKCRV
eukprot:scaffold26608_cov129-Isochrysis_galbana.AAC.1